MKPRQLARLFQLLVELFEADDVRVLIGDRRLRDISSTGDPATRLKDIIEASRSDDWVDELLARAMLEKPQSQALRRLVNEILGSPAVERLVDNRGLLLDLSPVLRFRSAVCLIRFQQPPEGNQVTGTGFLVAPDLVMTNHHVVQPVIDQVVAPKDVALVFDLQVEDDGVSVSNGVNHRLAVDNPIVGWSPVHALDLITNADPPRIADDSLDYALLRLARPVGKLPTPRGDPAAARGWIDIEGASPLPAEDTPLLIVQHPSGGVSKLAFEAESIMRHNAEETRVWHRTATEGGSSGSPCFNGAWQLTGIHNASDAENEPARYNQMVPMHAIRRDLQKRGFLKEIEASIAQPVELPMIVSGGPRTDNGSTGSVHSAHVLSNGLPFLDRDRARTFIQHFNRSADKVLVVEGSLQTGRTHTRQFINHLYRHHKQLGHSEFAPIVVDLKPRRANASADPITALRMASRIINQIPGLELPQRYMERYDSEQHSIWCEQVCAWLSGQLLDAPSVYWVVIDGCDEALIDKSASYFLDELIISVVNPNDSLRLVLLGYARADLPLDIRHHFDETTDLTAPENKAQLYEEISHFLLETDSAIAALEGDARLQSLGTTTAKLLERIDPDVGGQMKVLGEILKERALMSGFHG